MQFFKCVRFGMLDIGHRSKNNLILSVMWCCENSLQLKYQSLWFSPFYLLCCHYTLIGKRNEWCSSPSNSPVVCHLCAIMYCVCVFCTSFNEIICVVTPRKQQVMNCAFNAAESSCYLPHFLFILGDNWVWIGTWLQCQGVAGAWCWLRTLSCLFKVAFRGTCRVFCTA
jgi:hypothetical protein